MKLKRLAISCGGTGGHFYPGLSVARQLAADGGEVLLLLSGVHARHQQEVARSFGIEAMTLPWMPAPGLRRPLRTLRFCRGLAGGIPAAVLRLRSFRPDALLGMGSFASLPPVLAAKLLRIPIFLHDGNARIGRANRFLSRWAKFQGTAFPPVNAGSCRCPVACTGLPLRPELLLPPPARREALRELREKFGAPLEPERTTVLIFGGSQGAQSLNINLPEALKQLPDKNFQVLHLTGPDKFDAVREVYSDADFPVLVLPATEEMQLFYAAADLVVSRAGGSTVAELAQFGKPALLVPYPYAAENHQYENAQYLAAAGMVLDNRECTPERLIQLLDNFLTSPDHLAQCAAAAAARACPRAGEQLLEAISERL